MKKLGIHSVIRKKKKKYVSSTPEATAENKLGRDFYADAPNKKWATDVTEFKVPGDNKKLYLSAILDLYDRYPVAYVIGTRNDNGLVFRTFDKALAANPKAKPHNIPDTIAATNGSLVKTNISDTLAVISKNTG